MKNVIFTTFLFLILSNVNYGQILFGVSPCYAVSSGNNTGPNVLFKYDFFADQWIEIGVTGETSINAIATDLFTDIIYAVDGGNFGTIDPNTAIFNLIGEIGKANGDFGEIDLNDIKGLTYDPINKILYGTHRIEGNGQGTNDLLFKIDVSTGKVVQGAMLDANNNPVDYAVIEEVFDHYFDFYDVNDIAYNPYTGRLYAIQNFEENGLITEIYSSNGGVEQVVFDYAIVDVEGLAFTYYGELFGTTGSNSSTPNAFVFFDLQSQTSEVVNYINANGDFESLDCSSQYNDLALSMVLSTPVLQQPVYPGDNITCLITIHNQGDFPNTDISITNYVPGGLILTDQNWQVISGTYTVEKTIPGPLLPGTSTTISITFIVDNNYLSNSITNVAEIMSSYNPNITDYNGNLLYLSDIDSYPDNTNNEINVVDNEINGGGPNEGEDEDDHDIVTINVKQPCVNSFDTYYSGCVDLALDNNQNIIKNSYATIYDYSICKDYANLQECNPVTGFNNLAANEALWVITKMVLQEFV